MADFQMQQNDLKRRLREAELQNEEMILKIQRTKKLIQRARLERTILLERLEQSTGVAADPTTVESPPQSPIEAWAPPPSTGEPKKREAPDRKRNQPRNPALPKRAQNAYIIFCEAEKENVKRRIEEDPRAEIQDLTKAMAEAWKNLGPEGRKKYTDLYKADRMRYLREMAAVEGIVLTPTDQKEKQRAIKQLKEADKNQDNSGESGDDQTEDEKDRPMIVKRETEEPQSEPPSEATVPRAEAAAEPAAAEADALPEADTEAPEAAEAPSEAPSEAQA